MHRHIPIYNYGLLQSGIIQQIRVLQILPGKLDDPIEVKLKVTSLESIQECEVLSYMWGDPTRDHHILCDEQYLKVTASLIGILRILRDRRRGKAEEIGDPDLWSRPFWIDAVCINQDNIDERSAQVKLMGSMYRDAARVLSYLGPKPPYAEEVFTFLDMWSGERDLEALKTLDRNTDPIASAAYQTFASLFAGHAYFARLWIVQEVVLPRESRLEILCGRYSRPWSCFVIAFKVFKQFLRATSDAYMAFDGICSLRGDEESRRPESFLLQTAMICTFRQQINAFSPHDRVFGLLGMLREKTRAALALLDYRTDVYSCFVVATIVLSLEVKSVNYLRRSHTVCDGLQTTWSAFYPESVDSVSWTVFKSSHMMHKSDFWFSVGDITMNTVDGAIDPTPFLIRQPVLHIDAMIVDIVTYAMPSFSKSNLSCLIPQACQLVRDSPNLSITMSVYRILDDALFESFGSEEDKSKNALLFELLISRWYLMSLGFSEQTFRGLRGQVKMNGEVFNKYLLSRGFHFHN